MSPTPAFAIAVLFVCCFQSQINLERIQFQSDDKIHLEVGTPTKLAIPVPWKTVVISSDEVCKVVAAGKASVIVTGFDEGDVVLTFRGPDGTTVSVMKLRFDPGDKKLAKQGSGARRVVV